MLFEPLSLTDKTTTTDLAEQMAGWQLAADESGLVATAFEVGRYLAEDNQAPCPYSRRQTPKRWPIGDVLTLHYRRAWSFPGGQRVYHGTFEQIQLTLGGKRGQELLDGQIVADFFRFELDGCDHATLVIPAEIQQRLEETYLNPFAGDDWWPTLLMSQASVAETAAIHASQENQDRQRAELIHRWGLVGQS